MLSSDILLCSRFHVFIVHAYTCIYIRFAHPTYCFAEFRLRIPCAVFCHGFFICFCFTYVLFIVVNYTLYLEFIFIYIIIIKTYF